MPDSSVANLLAALNAEYPNAISRYGSADDEEHGIGFRIEGIQAVFSVLTLDGSLPPDTYDIQVESFPPGDYIFTAQRSLVDLLALLRRYRADPAFWP